MIETSCIAWRGCLVLALVAGLCESSSAGFTIRDLGVLTLSGTSGGEAINANGDVAGFATNSSFSSVAVKSMGSGNFQPVSLPPDSASSLASSINVAGNVAGVYTDVNGARHGFFTTTSQTVTIKPLSVNGFSGSYTQANGINGANQVVGTGDIPGGATRAFLSGPSGTPSIINPLGTGGSNQGNGINDGGVVVGASQTSPGGLEHAFITDSKGTAIDLLSRNSAGNFAFNTYGMAISNNGNVVGSGDIGQFEHAFFASSIGGAMVDLGVLPGASSSFAYGVNDLAHVVGELDSGSSQLGQHNSRAFLWGGSAGMFDLNTLISSSDQSKWVLTKASGINGSDQIAGEGYLNGVLHGFVLTPIAGESIFAPVVSIPEPPTFVLSVLGFGITASWIRVRRGRSGGRGVA